MTETENPVLAAYEAWRVAHPRRADEGDEAFQRFDPSSEAGDTSTPAEADASASEQLAIDEADLETIFPIAEYPEDHVGPRPERTIREAFLRFHGENPHVYEQLLAMAQQAQQAGASKLGIGMMFEVLRWQATLRTGGDDFKLNNNYRSYYARLIVARNPSLEGVFEMRRLHGRGLSAQDVAEAVA